MDRSIPIRCRAWTDWQRHTATSDALTEALKLNEECLEIRKRVLGPEHPDTLRSMDGLAATYVNLGRLTEALMLYEECLEIRKRVLGPEHPDTLQTMNGLAATYISLGRSTEASKLREECLEIRKRVVE